MAQNAQSMWEILRITNDWIKVSDAKALAFIAFQGIFLSFALQIGDGVTDGFALGAVVMVVAVVLNGCSIFYAFSCLNPKLRLGGGISPLYFGSIAENFQESQGYYSHFQKTFIKSEDIERELAGQVYVNSTIAWKKFKKVGYSLRWMLASLACWGTYFILIIIL